MECWSLGTTVVTCIPFAHTKQDRKPQKPIGWEASHLLYILFLDITMVSSMSNYAKGNITHDNFSINKMVITVTSNFRRRERER